MTWRLHRLFAAPLLLMALGSCSYIFRPLAVVIDGRLAFIVDPAEGHGPDCARTIHVLSDRLEQPAALAAGDDAGLVINGRAYWYFNTDVRTCPLRFPIFYGDAQGAEADRQYGFVSPKPLRIGSTYRVSITGGGSGSGSVWFRINPDRRIETFRDDPTPSIVNEGGYVVERR